ncbi:MAG: VOC family protein [Magnetococcales bacterium]|nr:VOC family protein [Magnetococcales bacterium]
MDDKNRSQGATGLRGIHHLAMVTADLDLTTRFWRDLIGLRLIYTHGAEGYRQYFFQVASGVLLSFFQWPGAEKIPFHRHGEPDQSARVFDHVSFAMDDDDALWAMADRLTAAGYPVSDVIDHGFIHSIYSYDPNGIPIEFTCPVAGVNDPERHPLFRDRNPLPEASRGPDPIAGVHPPPEPLDDEEKVILPGAGREDFLRT